MRKIEFPIGKKKEIIAMYSDKDIPVSEILETYHISRAVLSRILKEEAVPFRLPKAAGKRSNVELDKCPICHKSLMAKDARFCCWCGADARSEGEKLLDKLGELWTYIYPNIDYDTKEEAKKIFNDITTYIKNH